ncbi:MAG: carbohydrate kinase family protein, partial [Lachnospiraceae bacterium]|nr:carbohydrate kinase family protein [Lachnospiraceae bacterium]
VAYNLAKALKTLGDDVRFVSMMGDDFSAKYIREELANIDVSTEYVKSILKATPSSAVLYDDTGKRQIYCDLKDVQEQTLECGKELYEDCDIVIACNTNFNRDLLRKAKADKKIIVTDVHVLGDVQDDYNRDFMQYANILFLSDENIKGDEKTFIMSLENTYGNDIIILGRGDKGALMYVKSEARFYELPTVTVGNVVNTVGAGDALCSSFVHYYAKGFKADEALMRAQIFASYKIGFDGASVGFATEVKVEELWKNKKLSNARQN